MKKCEKCNSTNIEEECKSLSTDNVVKVYVCKDCGFKKTGNVEHIG